MFTHKGGQFPCLFTLQQTQRWSITTKCKAPQFIDRDLYIYVADPAGKVLAHGANAKLVGRDLQTLKDADGKPFVLDIIKIGESNKPGWVEYRWPNPVTKQIDDKLTYVEKANGVIYCAGVYK